MSYNYLDYILPYFIILNNFEIKHYVIYDMNQYKSNTYACIYTHKTRINVYNY